MAQANLQFQLSADDQTAQVLASFKKRIENIDDATNKLKSSVSNFGRLAISAFAAIQVGQSIKNVAGLADQYNIVNARLKVVTDSTQEFTSAQKALFAIAQNTRVGYSATVDLFTQLSRQTKDLNVPQEKMLKLTEGINKALIVSGATGQSAQNALIQLGQGFAAGALRGAEFMSVQEQAPRILEAVRQGLGLTQAQLKEMANEGKLTTEVFIEGFFGGLQKVENEFLGIPVTISQAMETVKTSVLSTVGEIDKLSGASETVSKKIKSLGESIVKFSQYVKENSEVISGVFAGTIATAAFMLVAAKWSSITASATALVAAFTNPVGLAILGVGSAIGAVTYGVSQRNTLEGLAKQLQEQYELIDLEKKRFNQKQQIDKLDEIQQAKRLKKHNENIEKYEQEIQKIKLLMTLKEMEKFGYPGQDYPDEIARLEKRKKPIFAAPLSKEQENLIKAREKMMQDINDRVLEAQKGERSLFELQAKRIGFGGEALKNLMMQYDVLQKIKADDEEIERITQEFEKVRKENEKTKKAQEELDEKNKNIVQTFREQMQLYQESIILRNDLTFKTSLQIEQEEQLIAVRKKYEEAERRIRYSDDENKEAKLKALDAEKKRIEELIVANTKMKEFQQNDLIGGGIKGYQKYLESITNFADQSQQAVERAFQGMENALVNFVQTGSLRFGDLARSIIADITRIYVRQTMIAPIMNALMPSVSGVSSFAMANANLSSDPIGTLNTITGWTGQRRAMGGPVTSGKSYLVGEDGPELFTPQANGQIISNGASNGITVHQVINVTTGVQQTVRAEILSLMPQIAGAAKAAVADAKLRGGSFAMAMR